MVCRGSIILAVVLAAGCADVRFERSAYTVRKLEVVYSAQEDLTFLSWQLRKDAKVSLVDFELWLDDGFQPIDLADAPFPAAAAACGDSWCFQYQLPGEWTPREEGSPIRSIHRRDGVFMGPTPRVLRVARTFDAAPIALGHNDRIDPRRYDWFAEQKIPLRRGYQWQFTEDVPEGCGDPTTSWLPASDEVVVDRAWTSPDGRACFHFRPDRADGDSPHVTSALFASAETSHDTQRYMPPRDDSPIVWGMLLDLHIRDAARCSQVKGRLIDMVEGSINARGAATKLGIFTPVDATTGDDLSGCDQSNNREYPLDEMLAAAAQQRGVHEPTPVRVLWVVVNNIDLPPSPRIMRQLFLFGAAIAYGDDVVEEFDDFYDEDDFDDFEPPVYFDDVGIGALGTTSFGWAIGSDVFLGTLPWDVATPWRPIEDDTFAADIKSAATSTLPFATMRHDVTTRVPIRVPEAATSRPEYVKLCQSVPYSIARVGVPYTSGMAVGWPAFDDIPPSYTVEIPPQLLVPNASYIRHTQSVVVEVCTAFCNGPFRSRAGDFDNWLTSFNCQWSL